MNSNIKYPVIFFFLFTALCAYPWTPATCKKMTKEARKLTPEVLKEILTVYEKSLMKGAVAPCKKEKSETHHLHINENYGKADIMINHLVNKCIRDIKNQKSFSGIIYKMGVIAHLVSDINNPLHTSNADGRESSYYGDYMKYMERSLPKFVLTFNGYDENFFTKDGIKNYLGRVAKRSHSSYDLLGYAYYRNGRLRSSKEFDDRSTPFGIASNSFSHSVSDIAKIWTYLWFKAGGNMKNTPYLPESVIERR